MSRGFKDHFSERSDNYANYRPTYPASLFDFLATIAPSTDAAWDCATGSGQAAVALGRVFDNVIATDASNAQIEAALEHTNVRYGVATAEASGLGDDSVDLVTAGQAFHWFDAERFFDEAIRVLRPNGVLAVWCYGVCEVAPECDAAVEYLYTDLTGPFWPPERKLIEDGYASLKLPGAEIAAPAFNMALSWTIDNMLGYLRTWSACKRYQAAHGKDPVSVVEPDLVGAWGSAERTVTWPLRVRIARLNTLN